MAHYDEDYQYEEIKRAKARITHNDQKLANVILNIDSIKQNMAGFNDPHEEAMLQAAIKLKEFEFWLKEATK